MSIVIDSLRSNEACLEPPSFNDRCQVEATFHTLIPGPRGEPQVQQMWESDLIPLRREIFRGPNGAQQVRFVLDEQRSIILSGVRTRKRKFYDLDY